VPGAATPAILRIGHLTLEPLAKPIGMFAVDEAEHLIADAIAADAMAARTKRQIAAAPCTTAYCSPMT